MANESFADRDLAALLSRIDDRDEAALAEFHARFTPRLVALARHKLGDQLNARTDPESVVQSVLGSFFRRVDGGEFNLGSWDDLWGLLAIITLRKCSNRRRFHRQARRDVAREVAFDHDGEGSFDGSVLPDTGPGPLEIAILHETLADMLAGLDMDDRLIIELLLAGHTIEETRVRAGCGERTVRRVRDRVRGKLQSRVNEP